MFTKSIIIFQLSTLIFCSIVWKLITQALHIDIRVLSEELVKGSVGNFLHNQTTTVPGG